MLTAVNVLIENYILNHEINDIFLFCVINSFKRARQERGLSADAQVCRDIMGRGHLRQFSEKLQYVGV